MSCAVSSRDPMPKIGARRLRGAGRALRFNITAGRHHVLVKPSSGHCDSLAASFEIRGPVLLHDQQACGEHCRGIKSQYYPTAHRLLPAVPSQRGASGEPGKTDLANARNEDRRRTCSAANTPKPLVFGLCSAALPAHATGDGTRSRYTSISAGSGSLSLAHLVGWYGTVATGEVPSSCSGSCQQRAAAA